MGVGVHDLVKDDPRMESDYRLRGKTRLVGNEDIVRFLTEVLRSYGQTENDPAFVNALVDELDFTDDEFWEEYWDPMLVLANASHAQGRRDLNYGKQEEAWRALLNKIGIHTIVSKFDLSDLRHAKPHVVKEIVRNDVDLSKILEEIDLTGKYPYDDRKNGKWALEIFSTYPARLFDLSKVNKEALARLFKMMSMTSPSKAQRIFRDLGYKELGEKERIDWEYAKIRQLDPDPFERLGSPERPSTLKEMMKLKKLAHFEMHNLRFLKFVKCLKGKLKTNSVYDILEYRMKNMTLMYTLTRTFEDRSQSWYTYKFIKKLIELEDGIVKDIKRNDFALSQGRKWGHEMLVRLQRVGYLSFFKGKHGKQMYKKVPRANKKYYSQSDSNYIKSFLNKRLGRLVRERVTESLKARKVYEAINASLYGDRITARRGN